MDIQKEIDEAQAELDFLNESAIRSVRNVHIFCKDRGCHCDGCPLQHVSNVVYGYKYCVASGDSPMNWDLEGIAK
jgi:hypothetical protein